MKDVPNFNAWWQGVAALPLDCSEQAYFVLRRIWADQTINTPTGARSFYRRGTEDHVTPALWQNWYLFEDPNAMAPFLRTAGARVGELKRVQWAYACEELTGVGRSFVTPDIIVHYEDEKGPGILAIEAKRHGQYAKREDRLKLDQYCKLPSMRGISRRHGCFLVSEKAKEATRTNTDDHYPVVTWEELAFAQRDATHFLSIEPSSRTVVENWIARAFDRVGLGSAAPTPSPHSIHFGTAAGYAAIRERKLPPKVELFLMGSECVEASWLGIVPEAPLPWLASEPVGADVRRKGFQTTDDRRVCRWAFDWTARREVSASPHSRRTLHQS